MTVTIDLPPDEERKLLSRAASHGQGVAEYIRRLVKQDLNAFPLAAEATPEQRAAAWDHWIAQAAVAARNLPPGHLADDSRETIYAGRGE